MNKEEARKADNRWSSNSGSGRRLVLPAGLSSPPPPPHRAAREPPRSPTREAAQAAAVEEVVPALPHASASAAARASPDAFTANQSVSRAQRRQARA
eukprot:scaffold51757_cov51-Phaeocystis_antarctica.AAC.1